MTAEAISRVTSALQARLQAALVASDPLNPSPGNVFVGPFDDPHAQAAALSLFPYRIVPNASLRNTEHRVPSPTSPPPYIVYRDALPLDVYYLISVGSRPGFSEEPLLRVLGFAIQALQMTPELPGTTVTAGGIHVSLEPDVVRVTLEPLGTDEISRIWALFPTANYRTSVAYVASPVWIDPVAPAVLAAPVVQDRLGSGQGAALMAAG
jgi:hypothetical protein